MPLSRFLFYSSSFVPVCRLLRIAVPFVTDPDFFRDAFTQAGLIFPRAMPWNDFYPAGWMIDKEKQRIPHAAADEYSTIPVVEEKLCVYAREQRNFNNLLINSFLYGWFPNSPSVLLSALLAQRSRQSRISIDHYPGKANRSSERK